MYQPKFHPPFFIGIAGGTGSGKSLFAKMITECFPNRVLTISHDLYYKDQGNVPLEDRKKANMDVPEALDNKLLFRDLLTLKKGKGVELPDYDFVSHTRKKRGIWVESKNVIIVEGILTLSTKYLRDFFDLKIYIEVDPDLRLARRIIRDVKEKREETLEKSIDQYLSSAYPMYYRYVVPQMKYADLVIPWNKMSHEAVETVSARIKDELEERGVKLN